jgi:plastocyanin
MSDTPHTRRQLLVSSGLAGLSAVTAGCLGGGGNGDGNGNDTNGNDTNGNDTNGNDTNGNDTNGNGGETGDPAPEPPRTEFTFEYVRAREELTITVTDGDSFDPANVSLVGSRFEGVGTTWAEQSGSDQPVTGGETLTLAGVGTAFLLDIVWTNPESDEEVVLADTEGPEANQTPPETEFEFQYAPNNEILTITVAGGDSFDPTQTTLDGNGFDGAGTTWATQSGSDETVTVGDTLALTGVEPGFFLNIFWVPAGTGEGTSLAVEQGPGTTPSDDGQSEAADEYLQRVDATGYTGPDDIVDATGQSSVTVANGPGGSPLFAPPALRIDAGTTVRWVWGSDGNSVEQTESSVPFEATGVQDEGFSYEWTFDTTGLFLYRSGPGSDQGQHGALLVE